VPPIFANLNKDFSQWFSDSESYSADEVMIPYYRGHSSKQYVHGNPILYGYKVTQILIQLF
jgi:hypothetical protein